MTTLISSSGTNCDSPPMKICTPVALLDTSSNCKSPVFCSNRSNSLRERNHVGGKVGHRSSRLRSPEITTSSAFVRHGIAAGLNGRLQQARHVVAQPAQLALQPLPHIIEGETGVMLIEVIGRLHQLRRACNRHRSAASGSAPAPLGTTITQQDALFRQPQELDLLEYRFAPRRQDDTGELADSEDSTWACETGT